ncbi:putative rhamnogalacturonate lyase C, partial [Colletotrichum viniferum]
MRGSRTLILAAASHAAARLTTGENSTHLTLTNDRLSVVLTKSSGHITDLTLDGQDLLDPLNGNRGKGPYLDCSCTPSGFWTPGGTASLQLINGTDSTGTPFGGLIMSDKFAATNQTLSQYFFLRGEETGLHAFSRLTYLNESKPLLRDLGELRTLFRPNTPLWTQFSTSDGNFGPLPKDATFSQAVTVQDATTYVGGVPDDPYTEQYSDYFTKYTLSESWRNHDVHGQFSDGSTSVDGSTFGAWLVHNTMETYYGGPLHSDLVVDGIVYNYMVSGHHGAPMPNITHGFDRTWGTQFYYFNKGAPKSTVAELRTDAVQFADAEWNEAFYDSIAEYVPNFIPSTQRTVFEGAVQLPEGAKRPIIVLSENKQDFQLNVFNTKSLQYWAEIDESGNFRVPRVVEGTYRVTIYADGVFGWYIQDDVEITKDTATSKPSFDWKEESAGEEVWRIGVPDKSSGEYLHGYALDTSKPLQPEQYRIYWGKYDYEKDFPEGVNFQVGQSDEAQDLNYIHWAFFPARGNHLREENYYDNVNNWTITFDLTKDKLDAAKTATFTVQIAGTKTANGNAKWTVSGHPYSNLPWTVNFNNLYESTWVIPYWRSGSCGVRSAVACQNIENKFTFSAEALKEGRNELTLSLPFNASSVETALLPDALYVHLYEEGDVEHTGKSYNRILYATTSDFVEFSEARVWQDSGGLRYDSTVIEVDGVYHRFTKDDSGNATGCQDIIHEKSRNLSASLEGWDVVASCISSTAGVGEIEGPAVVKSNPGDVNGEKYFFYSRPPTPIPSHTPWRRLPTFDRDADFKTAESGDFKFAISELLDIGRILLHAEAELEKGRQRIERERRRHAASHGGACGKVLDAWECGWTRLIALMGAEADDLKLSAEILADCWVNSAKSSISKDWGRLPKTSNLSILSGLPNKMPMSSLTFRSAFILGKQ